VKATRMAYGDSRVAKKWFISLEGELLAAPGWRELLAAPEERFTFIAKCAETSDLSLISIHRSPWTRFTLRRFSSCEKSAVFIIHQKRMSTSSRPQSMISRKSRCVSSQRLKRMQCRGIEKQKP
jgi:hypothetical protein